MELKLDKSVETSYRIVLKPQDSFLITQLDFALCKTDLLNTILQKNTSWLKDRRRKGRNPNLCFIKHIFKST